MLWSLIRRKYKFKLLLIRDAVRESGLLLDSTAGEEGMKVVEKWKAPEYRWYKVNCVGGFKEDIGVAGIGVVVRNVGVLVDGCCETVNAENALVVEALAVRRGMKLAIEKNY